jgi:Pregnancy-associated plasma protein-A
MQKIILFILLIVICNTVVFSQSRKECGTTSTEADRAFYTRIRNTLTTSAYRPQATSHFVKVFIHDFIATDGSDSAWSRAEINNEFAVAVAQFKPYNICLVLAGVDFPRNTGVMNNFDKGNIGSIYNSINRDYAIDITLHKVLTDGASNLNGTAYSIPSKTNSLSRGAIGQNSMAHELGHALGLYHVFETEFGLECPDGSNALSAGDKIADTRATPDADAYMGNNTDINCNYSGTMTISCNNNTQLYNPEVINIMCYGRRTCRSIFTPNQVNTMKAMMDGAIILNGVWDDATADYSNFTTLPDTYTYTGDTAVLANNIFIGNVFSSGLPNIFIGGIYVQKFTGASKVTLGVGVQASASSLSNSRGYIEFKAGAICDATNNY